MNKNKKKIKETIVILKEEIAIATNNIEIDINQSNNLDVNNLNVDINQVNTTNHLEVDINQPEEQLLEVVNDDKKEVSNEDKKEIVNDKQEVVNDDKQEVVNDDKQEEVNDDKLVVVNDDKLVVVNDDKQETVNDDKKEVINDDKKEVINDDKKEVINDDKQEVVNDKQVVNEDKEEVINEDKQEEKENFTSTSKNKKKLINTLCFSGGGIKGFSFIGALEKLIENNIINLEEITLYVGTSAGAIISLLLNLGWNTKELKDFVINFNFTKLTGEIDSINFFENYGIQDGERLKLLFIKFLESKLDKRDITFEELYKITKKKIIIIGTNLTIGKEKVFSVDETPEFSVILALRISVSVPIIFTPIKFNNEIFVDGGLVNNFPINHCPKKSTIGFYIKNAHNNQIDSVKTLITSALGVAADTISEKNIKKYIKNVIQIKNTEYNITNFEINLEFKLKLINLGYIEAQRYLDQTNLNEEF